MVAASMLSSLARARRKARLIAGAVFGVIRAALAEWLQGGGQASLVERAHEGLALFARVLDTELHDDTPDPPPPPPPTPTSTPTPTPSDDREPT